MKQMARLIAGAQSCCQLTKLSLRVNEKEVLSFFLFPPFFLLPFGDYKKNELATARVFSSFLFKRPSFSSSSPASRLFNNN